MTPTQFRDELLRPGLRTLATYSGIPYTLRSERLLLAIAIQESALVHRYQVVLEGPGPGPARGWWQFEMAGVAGVLGHPRTVDATAASCAHYHVEFKTSACWRALEGHDGLAVAFARLLLWTDPRPLPDTENDSYSCYLRNWKPGRPSRTRWTQSWAESQVPFAP